MRPVDKGDHPLQDDGTRVVFNAYADAAPYLKERLGRYCSYCERHISTQLAVEHVSPKSHHPELEKVWKNFLLACVNCNSHKSNKLLERSECLWPVIDDTFSALTYEASGAVNVALGLDAVQKTKALALLALVGLDKPPEQASDADYRHRDRLEQWGKAKAAFDLFHSASALSLDSVRDKIVTLDTEGYSIWATVFRADTLILKALARKYPGTRD